MILVLLLALGALAAPAAAGPKIIATGLESGCTGGHPSLSVTLQLLTAGYYQQLEYHVDSPSGPVLTLGGSNPVLLKLAGLPPGQHTLVIRDGAGGSSKVYSFESKSCITPKKKKGMTWSLLKTNAPSGTVRVGCGNSCDPYKGDTLCTSALPVLCFRDAGLPVPATVDDSNTYNRWSGGLVATTAPTLPPPNLVAANGLCTQEFGADWRVAEFHEGWGWSFQAYGGIGDPQSRFWVYIDDQPANCW